MSLVEMSAVEQENCLNLNVYTPSLKGPGATLLPVMMYVNGKASKRNVDCPLKKNLK